MTAGGFRLMMACLVGVHLPAFSGSVLGQSPGLPDGEAAAFEATRPAPESDQSSPGGLRGDSRWAEWQRMTGDWARLRSRLDTAGVHLSSWSVSDVSGAAGSGARSGSAVAQGVLDVDATFDLEKLAGLPGASVFVQYFGNVGADGSESLEAYQAYSNIDADRFHRVGELWYEQWLAGRRLRVKVGRVDANSEFARVENASEFINASMGYSPTISALPTYPSPAWSANVFVYPTSHLYVGVGAYSRRTGDGDGDEDDVRAALRAFLIGEAGVRRTWPGQRLRGRLGIGAWYEPATWQALDGSPAHFPAAPFVAFDHDLWRGPSGEEDDDVAGFGVTAIRFSPLCSTRSGRETAFGPFYKWQATGWLEVKPDLQFVRNAGGTRGGSYSIAATLRLRVEM